MRALLIIDVQNAIVIKHAPNSFYQTNLLNLLRAKNISELIVCGRKGENPMTFCRYCSRQVQGKKTVNWFVLLIMCLITGGGWLFLYLPYYIFFKSPSCPICGAKL